MSSRSRVTVGALAVAGTVLATALPPAPPRAVAFTFDDLPQARFVSVPDAQAVTGRLLTHIRAARIPAIGFVNEIKLERDTARPQAMTALLEAWLDAGADLGNHGYAHRRFWDYPLDEVEADVLRGERVITRLLAARGRRPRFYRHPTLNTGTDSATRATFERFLGVHGYAVAPVTIDNDDYLYALAYDHARAGPRPDTALMARLGRDYVRYMEETFAFYETLSVSLLGREPAQVLLLHANALNADFLGDLAAMLTRRGYRFVSLDEALQDPAYQLPDHYIGPRGISWLQRWAITQGRPPGEQPQLPDWVQAATQLGGAR